MKKIAYIFLLLSLVSCKDFLDIKPKGKTIPKTAQDLIIHRTTLLYRLKKLMPLLGVDLDDPWKRLYLMLSLFIMERRESVPRQEKA